MKNNKNIDWLPIESLTIEKIIETPIWETDYFGDEEFIRATNLKTIPEENEDKIYIALTKFELADGSSMTGFCCPKGHPWLDETCPAIIHDKGIWDLCAEDQKVPLSKKNNEVFPLTFECLVDYKGKRIKSQIYEN